MNEIFSFHKELNIKKIIIFCLIVIVLISFVIFKIAHKTTEIKAEKIEAQNPYSIFEDDNSKVKLTLSKDYKLSQFLPSNNHILELRSENDLNIYIETQNIIENRNLKDVASADILAYTSSYSYNSNISEIKEIENKGLIGYTYSFQYLDPKTKLAYYLQTIWFEKNSNYYIIGIEFPLDNISENVNTINDVLNNLEIY